MSDVIIVGAGQAGLAMGRVLQKAGASFEILEARARPSGSWPDYYDSLTLFSPAAYSALPDLPFPGRPDVYPRRDEVAAYLERYADTFDLPVRTNATVVAAAPRTGGWRVRTADGAERRSRALVVASGTFGSPYTPEIPGAEAFRGEMLHAAAYRRPEPFAGKRVVVVGAANSAVQIATELAELADVTLASRAPVRYAPQRLLGRDVHFWFKLLRVDESRLSDQGTPVLDQGRYRRALAAGRPARRPMFTAFHAEGVAWADGTKTAADAVIFATGYRPHLPFLDGLPIRTADGGLRHTNGASHLPGLYFIGQPGLRRFASATLRGVGGDAEIVARQLLTELRAESASSVAAAAS